LAAADARLRPPRPARPPRTTTRELVTPEGVDLGVDLGSASQRAGAFIVDMGIILLLLIAVTVVALVGFGAMPKVMGEAISALWLLGFFLLRNFYFVFFELRPGAATPGKRLFGLRVTARNGGRLDANAVFARNAMREIEVYLPLSFLVANAADADGWLVFFGLVWTGVFVLFPLFNRDRLRVGDFVAGTWVVRAPKRRLLEDLAGRRDMATGGFAFSQAQLDAYGVKELQVLEDVLRRSNLKTRAAVAERIRRKIGWTPAPDEVDWAFLEAYYAALRGRLEARLLLGKRKQDKFDQG
jgi:uncharacterized RDD family membrane protein YckC